MITLADVFRRHGEAYLQRYGDAVLPSHVRAVRDVVRCRTGELGGHLAECTSCGHTHLRYHSCRNRACPSCGRDATARWLAQQRELLLPVSYYHVVFTLPAELRRVVRTHQRVLLGVLFRAAFDALQAMCHDPRWLGGRIGALAVLHTWTRMLEWHPHVHLLVPAGGVAADGRTLLTPRQRKKPFLVPVKVLSGVFRERFLKLARMALGEALPDVPRGKRWVVFCKPTVQGAERVLDYLGRYVHRTALTDHALLRCDEQSVRFAYTDSKTHERKAMTLPAHEFMRRFLQHVPLKGLHRVRAFGLLHSSHRTELRRLQLLLGTPEHGTTAEPESKAARCPVCKTGQLRLYRRLTAEECAVLVHDLAAAAEAIATARAPPLTDVRCRCA